MGRSVERALGDRVSALADDRGGTVLVAFGFIGFVLEKSSSRSFSRPS
jgi:hypothetical protein